MIRLGEWWSSRIGPLLAVGYAYISLGRVDTARSYRCLAALVVSATMLAAYAYVINDSCDIDCDRTAGKPNSMAGVSPGARVCLALGYVAAGLMPWVFVDPGPVGWACLLGILLLPLLYSVPPVRLKQRGAWGLVSDAVNVHTLPVLFVAALFLYGTVTPHRSALGFTALLVVWSLGWGLRSITRHQLLDRGHDEAAGLCTFVVRVGAPRAQRIARGVFFPAEVGALAGMGVLIGIHWPSVLIVASAYLLVYRAVWVPTWRSVLDDSVPEAAGDYVVLVEFYQLWPALLLAGCAVAVDPAFGWLIPLHLALFLPTASKQSRDLWHLMLLAATRRRAVRVPTALRPTLPAPRRRPVEERRLRRRTSS